MVWTSNPPISTLLPAALSIDETVREELAKANPGTLEPTQAVVSDGDAFNDLAETSSATVAVDNYGVTHVTISPEPVPTKTKALVANGVLVDVPINSDNVGGFTPTVVNGALTGIALDEATGVVVNGQELAVDGGTVTISVVGGIVSATFTPGA